MSRVLVRPMAALAVLMLAAAVLMLGQADPSDGDAAAAAFRVDEDEIAFIQQQPFKLSRLPSADVRPPTLGPMVAAQRSSRASTPPPPEEQVPRTAADAAGVHSNSKGDLAAFLSALFTNSASVAGVLVAFTFLLRLFPDIYSHNVKEGLAPKVSTDGTLGWLRASWETTNEQVEETAGLDHAMLLEFTNLGMKIMLQVGLPLVFICGPMNYLFGGHASGDDRLSYLSMGNVVEDTWLYWVHAAAVWGVVIVVTKSIYDAQRAFLPRRFRWLRSMAEPRCSTVLVEGIPYDYRSDAELRKFFVEMFSEEKVRSVYVTKDTTHLLNLKAQKEYIERVLKETESAWEQAGKDESNRPMMLTYTGHRVDTMEYYRSQADEVGTKMQEERKRILSDSAAVGGVNGSTGFVTFASRSDAEIAQHLNFSPDDDEWTVSTPPGPDSVRWSDLMESQEKSKLEQLMGYGLVAGLYFAYLPIVVGIAKYAGKINMGPLQPVWQGLAPSLGLTIMVSYLPTFLILIFKSFFVLKDEAWAQHKLQNYYFWFNVTFVILVTAVGSSVVEFARTLMSAPLSVFSLFGATMPSSTHFYMNFLVMQWMSHSLNLLRYVPLAKYLAFRKLYGDEEAKKMAEPEDQDYYGIGSRSARWTTNLLIGIIFSTLSPPVSILCFLNFVICRLQYGYLIPFAETRKADLGGAFFVQQLDHLFVGLIIYCILMVGVLSGRAQNLGPAGVAAPALGFVLLSWRRFKSMFEWEQLPFTELIREEQKQAERDAARYVQAELEDTK